MAGSPKRLVIDTDIASSAGSKDVQEGRSKCCREFLNEVLATNHKVVTTEAIRDEWHRHLSGFTRRWLVAMIARKRVCWMEEPFDKELRSNVEAVAANESEQAAMLKDVHLIEAACKADRIVLSMDEKARKYFSEAALDIGTLKQIMWKNPSKEEEKPLEWLRDGAELQKECMLGYHGEAV